MSMSAGLNSEWVHNFPQANSYPNNFCTKLPFFEKKTAMILKDFFNDQSKESYFQDLVNNRWGLKKLDPFSGRQKVIFDVNGHVLEENVSLCYSHYKNYDTFQKIVIIAIEKFAEAMKWSNGTYQMSISFMQHQLNSNVVTPGIEFHRDSSDYTAIIMLDDSLDEMNGWEGGHFLFRSLELPSREHTITPELGYGILFSNSGTQHAVTQMKVKSNSLQWADRTIFTIHEYGFKAL